MINKENCKIVQDLLPNYIENLTNSETNHFVKGHLDDCNECKNIFESMKNNITATVTIENKEINFLKKINRKIFFLVFIIAIFFLVIFAGYIRKFYILFNISNKISNLESITNYYAKVTSIDNDSLHIVESFVKDNTFLTNLEILARNDAPNISMYKNPNENIAYFISHNVRHVDVYNDINASNGLFVVNLIDSSSIIFKESSFIEKLIYVVKIKNITNTICHNSPCYLIDFYDGSQLWIEKDTGLTLRSNAVDLLRTQDYEYILNTTDEITPPDISDYIINYK